MKEMKMGECRKCKQFFYIHDHHILSKSVFGEGETAPLCPNCHTHFHEYCKKNTINPKDQEEAIEIWKYWLKKVAVVRPAAGLVALTILLFT